MEDLVIVGASFAGLACARSAALRGLQVSVLERRAVIGVQTHTTGIVVKEAAEDWEIPPRLTRKIHGVRLYSPSLRAIDLDSPGYYFLATDTPALIRWLAREAQHAGVRIRGDASYRHAARIAKGFEIEGLDVRARYLVGADGPNSTVAADFGLGKNGAFLAGAEVEMEDVRGVDADRLHCFLDSTLAPGYIGWLVPGVGGLCQVGLACRRPARPSIRELLAKLGRVFDFSSARIRARRGGLIPIGGRVTPSHAPGVLLVGDAAGLVSPLTGGGIHTALDSGWRAGHAIADHLLDGSADPGAALARHLPRFHGKRLARRLFDLDPPNALYDFALGSGPMRAVARMVYFHKRGALSRDAWREIWQELRGRPPRPSVRA